MIPDFKTYISESIWADIYDRSTGETERKEDFNRLKDALKKTKDMEFIHFQKDWRVGPDYAFAPYNFGAKSVDEPGFYLNSEELKELYELLQDTEFEMANGNAWECLVNRPFEKKKIKGYWHYIFHDGYTLEDSKTILHVPNFGFISDYFAKHPEEEEKVYGYESKLDHFPYAFYSKNGAHFITIRNSGNSLLKAIYKANEGELTDKIQVRLVRRIS